MSCDHLEPSNLPVEPTTPDGCHECLAEGGRSVTLPWRWCYVDSLTG